MGELIRRAKITAPETVELEHVPLPQVEADEVLIETKAVGICTLEKRFFKGISTEYPFLGGHEIAGTVAAKGSNTSQQYNVGDRVVISRLVRCGECYFCRRGYDNMCEENAGVQIEAEAWGPSGFSEYILVKGYEVFPVDPSLDFATATMAEPIACVIRSVERGGIEFGDTVLVLGAGVMGLLHLFLAKVQGARVLISDPHFARREFALQMGADGVIDPFKKDVISWIKSMTAGRGCEAVFFTAGGIPAVHTGLDSLTKNGTLVIYGSTGVDKEIIVNSNALHYGEISVTGVTKHTRDSFRKASILVGEHRNIFEKMISQRIPFRDIKEGFIMAEKNENYRVVLEM